MVIGLQIVVPLAAGIGKSSFGLYVLYRALMEGRTVVYRVRKDGCTYLYRNGVVHRSGDPDAFSAHLANPLTVCIVDGDVPVITKAFTVLITSPRRDRWFETPGVRILCFPTFSLEEMLRLRDAAFASTPDCDDDAVRARYALWGGVPRYVLTLLDVTHQRIISACDKLQLDELMKLVSAASLEAATEDSHRIIHFRCQGEVEPLHEDSPRLTTKDMAYYTYSHAEVRQ
jgi:hypothetical protein